MRPRVRAALVGLGVAQPPHSIAQPRAAELAQTFCAAGAAQPHLLPLLFGRSGVRTRGSVLLEPDPSSRATPAAPTQHFFPPAREAGDHGPTTRMRMARYACEAAPLAAQAAQLALERAQLPASAITQLITVSCTGFDAPGVDAALVKRLGCAPTVGRTHVGFMGCHGSLNALRVASSMVRAEASARVLLCAVELCSLHFRYGWDPEKLVANALFADGAGAMVLARAGAPRASGAWRLQANGSCLLPESEEAMAWRIGDYGFEMTLSPQVPALIKASLRGWLEPWLAREGVPLAHVRSWAVHPGGPRILSAVAQALELPEAALAVSAGVLAECGNMSSATTCFMLERLRASRAPLPCLALAFGPGLAVETALFI